MTNWVDASDGDTIYFPIELRYSVWDSGLSRWDTDQTESIWDFGSATDYTVTVDGTTVWT